MFFHVICIHEVSSKMNTEQSSYCHCTSLFLVLCFLTLHKRFYFVPACHVEVRTTFILIIKSLWWDLSRNGRNCSLDLTYKGKFLFLKYQGKADKLSILTITQCSSCCFITTKHSVTSLNIHTKGFYIICNYCNYYSFLAILYVNILSLFLLEVGMKKLHNILFPSIPWL
jgi:hypothetical protein